MTSLLARIQATVMELVFVAVVAVFPPVEYQQKIHRAFCTVDSIVFELANAEASASEDQVTTSLIFCKKWSLPSLLNSLA